MTLGLHMDQTLIWPPLSRVAALQDNPTMGVGGQYPGNCAIVSLPLAFKTLSCEVFIFDKLHCHHPGKPVHLRVPMWPQGAAEGAFSYLGSTPDRRGAPGAVPPEACSVSVNPPM